MPEEKNIWMDRLKNPAVWIAFVVMMFSIGKFFSVMSVQINNISVLEERLDKKIKVINDMHGAQDELEIRIVILETKIEALEK